MPLNPNTLDFALRHLSPGTQVLVIDVDGVLMDNTPRLHHICEIRDGRIEYKTHGADWSAYEAEAPNDQPMKLCRMLKRLALVYTLVFLTARSANDFQVKAFTDAIRPFVSSTDDWFYQFKDTPPADESAVDYKRRIVRLMQESGLDIVAAIDDSIENIEMFKEAGICVLRCHDTITKHSMEY